MQSRVDDSVKKELLSQVTEVSGELDEVRKSIQITIEEADKQRDKESRRNNIITCSTVVLQCYRRQAIPMEQAKIRPSLTLYSLVRSSPNLVLLITSATPLRRQF